MGCIVEFIAFQSSSQIFKSKLSVGFIKHIDQLSELDSTRGIDVLDITLIIEFVISTQEQISDIFLSENFASLSI